MQPHFDNLGCCQADGADMVSKPGATVVQRGADVHPQQGLLDSDERTRACGEIETYPDAQSLHPEGGHVLAI